MGKKNLLLIPFLVFIFYTWVSACFAQKQILDSLENVLKTAKDTARINVLHKITWQYINQGAYPQAFQYAEQAMQQASSLNNKSQIANSFNNIAVIYNFQSNYEKALEYSFRAIKIQEEINDKDQIANSLNNIGSVYANQGNYEKALENHLKALKIRKETGNTKYIAASYNNIGIIYDYQGNYEKALENYLKALKIREEVGDKKGIASTYNNIGIIYANQGNYEKALENHVKALQIKKEIGDKQGIANSYNNIGIVYDAQKDYEKALDSYWKSLKIEEEIGDKEGIASSCNNIGFIYVGQGKYKKALDNYQSALKIQEEIGDKKGIVVSFINIGDVYTKQNNLENAYLYLNKALMLGKKIGYKDGIKETYSFLSKLFEKKQDYKQAYEYYKLYSSIKDSLLNTENSKNIARMQTIYETEKKDKEIQLLSKDKEIQSANLKKQRIINYSISSGLLLVIVLVFFIYRSYLQKQKANLALRAAYKEIAEKNKIVEEKNKGITDSIIYAKRIQQAILSPTDVIQRVLPQSFILYKPKDIVSGDFYWFNEINENEILLAVVDCTGHGVPGAFMSMIGNDLLNQIVIEKSIHEPNLILEQLHEAVVKALRQYDEEEKNRDGMDVALCSLEFKVQSSETTLPTPNSQLSAILHYAGAMRPLYVIRNTGQTPHPQLIEIKGNKFPIGGIQTGEKRMFTNHTLQLNQGDTLYLFSDGYVDQFGGSEGKKLMTKKFKELLLEIHNKSMQEQKEILTKTFSEWKGELGQVDDILVIGVKI